MSQILRSTYYEKCNKSIMPYYPFFIPKLIQIEKLSLKPKKSTIHNIQSLIKRDNNDDSIKCSQCSKIKLYKLGNIIWSNKIKHLIEEHQMYPSEYFIKVIINTSIIDNCIINKPLELEAEQIKLFNYIPLHYNKLLILDALMHQGSYPRYLISKNDNEQFIYSEHSGVISLTDKIIDNIIVSAETDRIDNVDDNIYLPVNSKILGNHEFLFHTHPNTRTYAGRLNEGIIYEFPSANDVLNFVKFHNEGIAQGSIVITPEGIYVIRPIWYQDKYNIEVKVFQYLKKLILKLEKRAVDKLKFNIKNLEKLQDPDIFHDKVGSNFTYINKYNKFLEPYNLIIEYYPRQKKNGEWCLRPINLQYLEIN